MRVDVAESLDLAYSYGIYESRFKDKEGKPTVEYGKYTTVWKKQSDGR
jgi:ketosteroid isomerase-like protein